MADSVKIVDLNLVEEKLFENMNDLRKENWFCDVRFDVNGTVIPCHRLILATMSPYFRTMFNGNFKENNLDTITMKDIETEAFEEIVNAMYSAKIRFHPGNAYFILKTSHLLELEMIEEACISYISENSEIDYLIDTCVFYRNIYRFVLYRKCIELIADQIVEYGKTDSFRKIPFDVFEDLLKETSVNDSEEQSIILLIMKWAKENNANRKDIQKLLDMANLETSEYVNSSMMSELLLVASDHKCFNNENNEGTSELDSHSTNNSNSPFTFYLNAINVKTGQRGWSVLTTDDGFNEHVLSSFYPTNSRFRKVCRIGTKLYCFEYFINRCGPCKVESNSFSCYNEEDGIKISLPTPTSGVSIERFEMTAIGTSICLMVMNHNFSVWLYDCETSTWRNIMGKTSYYYMSACVFSDNIFYIIAKKNSSYNNYNVYNYVIFSLTYPAMIVEEIAEVPLTSLKYSSICLFKDKIAVFGTRSSRKDSSDKDRFVIFDLTNSKWSTRLTQLNGRHVHPRLFHYNDAVYAVENSLETLPSEKYDLLSPEWIDLPHLPKRITISNTNTVVATGEVFGVEITP